MAIISRGYSFGATEQVTNSKLHTMVDSASLSAITNSDIDAGAAIADTKLAQITTADKVSCVSLTSLDDTPSGAGVLPNANMFSQYTTAERNALSATEPLMIYNTTTHTYDYYNGTTWKQIATS